MHCFLLWNIKGVKQPEVVRIWIRITSCAPGHLKSLRAQHIQVNFLRCLCINPARDWDSHAMHEVLVEVMYFRCSQNCHWDGRYDLSRGGDKRASYLSPRLPVNFLQLLELHFGNSA
jgi:hypothetical protein